MNRKNNQDDDQKDGKNEARPDLSLPLSCWLGHDRSSVGAEDPIFPVLDCLLLVRSATEAAVPEPLPLACSRVRSMGAPRVESQMLVEAGMAGHHALDH